MPGNYGQQRNPLVEELLMAILQQRGGMDQMNQPMNQPMVSPEDYSRMDAAGIDAGYAQEDYQRRLSQLDSGSGLLGYFGKKSRMKDLEQFRGTHKDELMRALAETRGVGQKESEVQAMIQQMQEQKAARDKITEQNRMTGLGANAGIDPAVSKFMAAGGKMPAKDNVSNLAQSLLDAGIDPRSPEGQQIIKDNLTKGNITTNIPAPPSGYMYDNAQNPTKLVPILGGPAEQKQQELTQKAEGRKQQVQSAGNVVLRETSRALELVTDMHQGEDTFDRYWRAGRAKIKGTPEEVLMTSVLGPIKAELAFARIQTMRENSPTGGALGNVSNFEVDNLQKTAGLFDADMPLSMLKENIVDLRHKFLDAIHGTSEQRAQLVQQGSITPAVNAQIEGLYKDESSPGGQTQPPQAAIDALRKNPALRDEFIKKYGVLPEGM